MPVERRPDLDRSYGEVGDRTWLTPDFGAPGLEVSRALFTPESLLARQPRPKSLEVFALLGGLPFQEQFCGALVQAQRTIAALLGERLHYWVAAANMGVEFCVFKWPDGPWRAEWLGAVEGVLAAMRQPAFRLHIGGVQVNPDGCIVAKGFDEQSRLFRIREHVTARLPFIPERQSRWAHVPLGRILEPLGARAFANLSALMKRLGDQPIATTEIDSVALVHEMRWYMEEKTVLSRYALAKTTPGISS